MSTNETPVAQEALQRIRAAVEAFWRAAQTVETSLAWQKLLGTAQTLGRIVAQATTASPTLPSYTHRLDPNRLVAFFMEFFQPAYVTESDAETAVFCPRFVAEKAKADGLSVLAALLDALAMRLTVRLVSRDAVDLDLSVGQSSKTFLAANFDAASLSVEIDLDAARAALVRLAELVRKPDSSHRTSPAAFALTKLQGRLKLLFETRDDKQMSLAGHVLEPLELATKNASGDLHIVVQPANPLVLLRSNVAQGELALTLGLGGITATLPKGSVAAAKQDAWQVDIGACQLTASMQQGNSQIRLGNLVTPAHPCTIARNGQPWLEVGVTPEQPERPLALSLLPVKNCDVHVRLDHGVKVAITARGDTYEIALSRATALRLTSTHEPLSPFLRVASGCLSIAYSQSQAPLEIAPGQGLVLLPANGVGGETPSLWRRFQVAP